MFLNGAGCELGAHDCTDIGCADNASLRITSDADWAAGSYRLDLSLDEREGSVEFALPDDLPPRGSVTWLKGIEGVDIGLQEVAECTSVRHGDAISQSCQPIPNRYELTIGTLGTPARFSVALARDAETVVEESGELAYRESRPNGPECGPVCSSAEVELAF
jgi:hypothetical protein